MWLFGLLADPSGFDHATVLLVSSMACFYHLAKLFLVVSWVFVLIDAQGLKSWSAGSLWVGSAVATVD